MQVVITKAQLEAVPACQAYLKSPEWNGEALVYADWNATVKRLLSSGYGITYLGFLVKNKLVPLTVNEFRALRSQTPKEI